MAYQKGKPQRSRVLASILGMITPLMLISLVLLLGALEPGYSHMSDTMSLLGGVEGVRGAVFLLGGGLTGVLVIIFALGLFDAMVEARGSKLGPILLILGGIGLIGSAIFHCSAGCKNILVAPTLSGRLHILFSFLTGSCMALSPLVTAFRMTDRHWVGLRRLSVISGILANIPGLILWTSFFTTRIPAWEGLIQRLGLLFPLLWIGVMAHHLYKLESARVG